MTKVYGVGIMGAGNISSAYLKLAPLFKNMQVRAIADLNGEAATSRAKEYGVGAQTPEAMLKNSEIDVIVNLTIPSAHFAVTKDILSAGKHAYSEKPFVLSVEEGLQIKAMAEQRGLKVGSAPDTFLGGSHQQARSIIDSGKIGRIASGTMHIMGRGMEHWHPNPEFFYQPGGGPMLDMGPYYITDLIHLVGPIRRVTALTGKAKEERLVTADGPNKGTSVKVNTPTTIHAVLECTNGALVTLGASWDVSSHGHHNIELYGTDGTLYVPNPNFFNGELVVTDTIGTKSTIEAWDHPFGIANEDLDKPIPRANYRNAGLSDMLDTIGTSRKPRCDLDLALHAVDVMLSILKSGEIGEAVSIQTTCERPDAFTPEQARALLR
ncbi:MULTISPECIES: Gfo/Idh/MocA family protein [unclassified Rhizobium]|uniref:Gfo/Idh/MocA family protein n=1 Tax=unclassified Rhizobium TaxID=2613769 RepID=UPI001ADC6835|nr:MULTISPECIES: Gfo/Idh/MocA family oxidoreductase [unclassified Rhizobium]MBO9127752.1 Gfo/Idh/MocA family oxidoreductase [Rhizobium sp. 16-488-2b]MBO9178214.1 Gfo/Idh/MocA family oxidoreductase [Rhizobium sp. 16-488-2a]